MKQGFLRIPSDSSQKDFYDFSQLKDIPWQGFRRVPKTVGESDGGDNQDSEDIANNCDEELERDQDPFAMFQDEEVSLAIQGWMKLFVQHLHAKSILETFARHGGKEIDIKVYGLSPPENSLLLPTWEALKTIIRFSLQDKTIQEQDDVINLFLSHFQASDNMAMAQTDNDDPSVGKNNIFSMVSDIIARRAETRARYYRMHCEVALAGLVAASRSPVGVAPYANKEIVDKLNVGLISDFLQPRQLTHIYLQNLNPMELAVSKLCCPACWDYLDILFKLEKCGGETKMYKIRGRHSTVYPVQLPSWSRPEVVQELIKRFGKYLHKELDTMGTNHKHWQKAKQSGHTHNPSLQSVWSAITNTSNMSGKSNLDGLDDLDLPDLPTKPVIILKEKGGVPKGEA